jgi:hypothetical protein
MRPFTCQGRRSFEGSFVDFPVFVARGVILGCSYLIDLHTRSNLRITYPQVRGELR